MQVLKVMVTELWRAIHKLSFKIEMRAEHLTIGGNAGSQLTLIDTEFYPMLDANTCPVWAKFNLGSFLWENVTISSRSMLMI